MWYDLSFQKCPYLIREMNWLQTSVPYLRACVVCRGSVSEKNDFLKIEKTSIKKEKFRKTCSRQRFSNDDDDGTWLIGRKTVSRRLYHLMSPKISMPPPRTLKQLTLTKTINHLFMSGWPRALFLTIVAGILLPRVKISAFCHSHCRPHSRKTPKVGLNLNPLVWSLVRNSCDQQSRGSLAVSAQGS